MKRLDLYIGQTVVAGTLLAWLVVAALEGLFMLLGELGDVGRGDYTLGDALLYVLLILPGRAYQSFPMAAMIGALLALGNLAEQFELNAFRLAGCSPARLTRAVLQAGVIMLLLVVGLGEGWAPHTRGLASQLRTTAIFDEISVPRGSGFWLRDGMRLIHVGESGLDGTLSELVVFEIDATPELVSASTVARARYEQGHWTLEDVQESYFTEQGIDVRNTRQTQWPTLIDPRLARLLTRDAQTLSLPQLGRYIDYLEHNGSNVSVYRLSYWQRLVAPLAAIAMLFLAVSILLGPLGRRSTGQRILAGVVIGLVFKLFNEINAHAGLVYGIQPWLNALLPSSIVFLVGVLLLRRGR